MPNPSVYIETTIVSYLTCWPSRDIIRAGHELLTREWWAARRQHFDLYTSEAVVTEASAGDPAAAAERLNALAGIPRLASAPAALALAAQLAGALSLPQRARTDAIHLAVAAANGIDFLLTWNCRHLANGTLAPKIEQCCTAAGFAAPRILTPEMLMETP